MFIASKELNYILQLYAKQLKYVNCLTYKHSD